MAHLVAVAAFDVFVGVGLPGVGRGFVGGLVGGGSVAGAGGLTVAAELVELCFDGGNTAFVVGFGIFKSGKEVSFGFVSGLRRIRLIDGHNVQGRGALSFLWHEIDLFRLDRHVKGVV